MGLLVACSHHAHKLLAGNKLAKASRFAALVLKLLKVAFDQGTFIPFSPNESSKSKTKKPDQGPGFFVSNGGSDGT